MSTASTPELDPEDAKLVTLARSARVRAVTGDGLAAEGAAIRDETGRTYLAATVVRGPLRLPALHLAVASALASGARSFEAAAVVTAESEPAGIDVLAAIGQPLLVVADADGTVRGVGVTDVHLRVLTVEDADALQVEDTAELNEYSWFGFRRSGRLRSRIDAGEDLTDSGGGLAISHPDSSLIGEISWRRISSGPGPVSFIWEIGIYLLVAQRGKGYGVEAQRLVTSYLFDTTLANRVQASTDVTNIAEQRALEKAGFTREGILRGFQFRFGAWHDIVMYSKLRGEE